MSWFKSPTSWHNDNDVYKIVRDFHDSCTRVPEMGREQMIHTHILSIIEKELRKDCFGKDNPMLRYEHTGSTHDGVKIGRDGIEFDVMVIVKGGNTLTAVEDEKAGYYTLKPKNRYANNLATITGSSQLLSSEMAKNDFKGRLQTIIYDTLALQKYDILLVEHGPAIQMDVYEGNWHTKLYSVDMVLAFEIDYELYIPKSYREFGYQFPDIWRISYSLQEKAMFDGIYRNNLCKKQTLRVCKAMRIYSSELGLITSYHLKNALLYEIDDNRGYDDWRYDKLAVRVLGVWMRIKKFLDEGKMGSYFNRKIDLFDSLNKNVITKYNIRCRIENFCSSENEFLAMIPEIKGYYIRSRLESHSSEWNSDFNSGLNNSWINKPPPLQNEPSCITWLRRTLLFIILCLLGGSIIYAYVVWTTIICD